MKIVPRTSAVGTKRAIQVEFLFMSVPPLDQIDTSAGVRIQNSLVSHESLGVPA